MATQTYGREKAHCWAQDYTYITVCFVGGNTTADKTFSFQTHTHALSPQLGSQKLLQSQKI